MTDPMDNLARDLAAHHPETLEGFERIKTRLSKEDRIRMHAIIKMSAMILYNSTDGYARRLASSIQAAGNKVVLMAAGGKADHATESDQPEIDRMIPRDVLTGHTKPGCGI